MLLIPNDPDRRLNFLTNLGLGVAILLGLIVAIAHGGERTVTIAALGASMGAGGVLGFLFGIPGTSQSHISIGRVDTVTVGPGQAANVAAPTPNPPAQNPPAAAAPPQNAPPADAAAPAAPNAVAPPAATAPLQNAPPADAPAPAAPNAAAPPAANQPLADAASPSTAASNLEQVADWVTKLLLGGGLTQLQSFPPKIWQWSKNVAVGITDGQVNGPALAAQQAFAAGVLVYGFIVGFFAGFLITKLQLGKRVV